MYPTIGICIQSSVLYIIATLFGSRVNWFNQLFGRDNSCDNCLVFLDIHSCVDYDEN